MFHCGIWCFLNLYSHSQKLGYLWQQISTCSLVWGLYFTNGNLWSGLLREYWGPGTHCNLGTPIPISPAQVTRAEIPIGLVTVVSDYDFFTLDSNGTVAYIIVFHANWQKYHKLPNSNYKAANYYFWYLSKMNGHVIFLWNVKKIRKTQMKPLSTK